MFPGVCLARYLPGGGGGLDKGWQLDKRGGVPRPRDHPSPKRMPTRKGCNGMLGMYLEDVQFNAKNVESRYNKRKSAVGRCEGMEENVSNLDNTSQ